MKFTFLISILCCSACLGPIVGEKALPYTQDEIAWNVDENQLLVGEVELAVELRDKELFRGDQVRMELQLGDHSLADEDADAFMLRHSLQTLDAPWKEGPITAKLHVRTPDFEKTYVRNLNINNITFNKRTHLIHPSFITANTDSHGWLMGRIDDIGDINNDELPDLLTIDGHHPYIRISNLDLTKNYRTAWQVSDDNWDSITSCDFNQDGYVDIIVGNSKDQNGKGTIQIFYGPMRKNLTFSKTDTISGTEQKHAGTRLGPLGWEDFNYTEYPGIGEKLDCEGSVLNFSQSKSTVNHLQGNERDYYGVYSSTPIGILEFKSETNIQRKINEELKVAEISTFNQIDFNQNGKADLIVNNAITQQLGPQFSIQNLHSETRLYFDVSSNSTATVLPESYWSGTNEYAIRTNSTALGDINYDGYDDFATTLFGWGLTPEGFTSNTVIPGLVPKTTVYFGARSYPGQSLTFFHPTNANAQTRFGENVVAADFNGDGHTDLAISAPGYDAVKHPKPEVFIYYGPSFARFDRYEPEIGSNGSWFGHRMIAVDYNHDGRDDLFSSIWGGFAPGSTTYGDFEILYDTL